MKHFKQFLLAVCCLMIATNASAFEVNGVNYSTSTDNDGNTIVAVTSGKYSGVVVIPETVIYDNKEYPVTVIGANAFKGSYGLKAVVLPESIKRIETSAFYGCSNLKSIDIPEAVDTIGTDAFRSCISLKNVKLPSNLRSLANQVLYGCKALEEIKLPNTLEYVMPNALDSCSSLTELNLPASLKLFPNSFPNDDNLKSITVAEDNSCFTVEKKALYKKNADKSLTLWFCPNMIGTLDVSDKVKVLCNNGALNNVIMFKLIVPYSVETIESGSLRNTCLNEVELNANITEINQSLFKGCYSLITVSLPSTLKAIGSRAFEDCRIEKITLPSGLIEIGSYAFNRCDKLQNIEIPENVTTINEFCFNGCAALKSVTFHGLITQIKNSAFNGCQELSAVSLPQSLESLGSSAFSGCSSLAEIEIPANVNDFQDYLFSNCSSLKSINIKSNSPSFGEKVFYRAAIEEFAIPDGTQKLGAGMFQECKNLKGIRIPDAIIQIPQNCFANCTSLTSIVTTQVGVSPY